MKRSKSFTDHLPLLYLIATPIGNLKEISERALETIKEMDLIACEDTRNTKSLLDKYGIQKECLSLREHNEVEASNKVISLILEGKKVAYMSDAGYPAISDPGKILVQKARENDIAVATISGSNAALNALVASSLNSDHFYFHGFISPKDSEAIEELKGLKGKKETLIFYEAPHRISRTLKLFYEVFGDRKATIARELTKLNEEYIEGTLSELKDIDPSTLIGEFVIVIEGNKEESSQVSDEELLQRANYLLKKNISTKDVADIVSFEYNVNKNYVYQLLIKNKEN